MVFSSALKSLCQASERRVASFEEAESADLASIRSLEPMSVGLKSI